MFINTPGIAFQDEGPSLEKGRESPEKDKERPDAIQVAAFSGRQDIKLKIKQALHVAGPKVQRYSSVWSNEMK